MLMRKRGEGDWKRNQTCVVKQRDLRGKHVPKSKDGARDGDLRDPHAAEHKCTVLKGAAQRTLRPRFIILELADVLAWATYTIYVHTYQQTNFDKRKKKKK
jgi:hypothetical protein